MHCSILQNSLQSTEYFHCSLLTCSSFLIYTGHSLWNHTSCEFSNYLLNTFNLHITLQLVWASIWFLEEIFSKKSWSNWSLKVKSSREHLAPLCLSIIFCPPGKCHPLFMQSWKNVYQSAIVFSSIWEMIVMLLLQWRKINNTYHIL